MINKEAAWVRSPLSLLGQCHPSCPELCMVSFPILAQGPWATGLHDARFLNLSFPNLTLQSPTSSSPIGELQQRRHLLLLQGIAWPPRPLGDPRSALLSLAYPSLVRPRVFSTAAFGFTSNPPPPPVSNLRVASWWALHRRHWSHITMTGHWLKSCLKHVVARPNRPWIYTNKLGDILHFCVLQFDYLKYSLVIRCYSNQCVDNNLRLDFHCNLFMSN